MPTRCILCNTNMSTDPDALLCDDCYDNGQHERRRVRRVSPNRGQGE